MKTETKFLSIILLITAVLFSGGIYFLSKTSPTQTKETKVLQINYSKGQKIGSDSAKVKLVEFSDLQCPACLAAEPIIKAIRALNNPEVQLIYRHFPLPQHSHGKEAAYFSEAAAEQGKFWQMHDRLFETQDKWSALPDATDFFMDLVKELNLDEEKVKQGLSKESFKQKIDEDITEAQALGVNSTPTFFINGQKLNLRGFEDINTLINEELKK